MDTLVRIVVGKPTLTENEPLPEQGVTVSVETGKPTLEEVEKADED